ncbi:MAG: glutathione binding-like protein [Gammaproteobacteria bacterium]
MIELYGSPTPSAYTIAIMLEEIEFNYSVFPITKNNNEQIELELLKTTPNNIFPIILDREGPNEKPFVIFEPGAILMYLAEKSGKLLPTKNSERFDVLQWLLFENSKIGPTLGNTKHFMYHAPEEVPYAVKRFNNEAKRIFSIIENQLSENDFLAGEYSIADIATFPWVRDFERYGISADQIPNMCDWLARVGDRKAVSKGFDALGDLKE